MRIGEFSKLQEDTLTLLEEIYASIPEVESKEIICKRAKLIADATNNLFKLFEQSYSEEECRILERKFLNCLKTANYEKFEKVIKNN